MNSLNSMNFIFIFLIIQCQTKLAIFTWNMFMFFHIFISLLRTKNINSPNGINYLWKEFKTFNMHFLFFIFPKNKCKAETLYCVPFIYIILLLSLDTFILDAWYHRLKVNTFRKVKKPIVKKWCYTPSENDGISDSSSLAQPLEICPRKCEQVPSFYDIII